MPLPLSAQAGSHRSYTLSSTRFNPRVRFQGVAKAKPAWASQPGSPTPQARRPLAACWETSGRGTKVRITEVSWWTVGIGRAGASVYRSIRAAHPACGTGTISRAHTATTTAAGTRRVRDSGTNLCTGSIGQCQTSRRTGTLAVHARPLTADAAADLAGGTTGPVHAALARGTGTGTAARARLASALLRRGVAEPATTYSFRVTVSPVRGTRLGKDIPNARQTEDAANGGGRDSFEGLAA